MILDSKSGLNRPSTIVDLFQSAQLVAMLDNIHFFSRPFIAGDIEDLFELDVNTAFAKKPGQLDAIVFELAMALGRGLRKDKWRDTLPLASR